MNISKLQLIMNQRKINNSNLASLSGLSDVTISKILNGADAKISSVEKIAQALGLPVGYFFDEIDVVSGHLLSNNGGAASIYGDAKNIGKSVNKNKEIEHLKALLEEKERTIQILMNKQ
ncbi:hypothetical protein EZS27_004298 [termite gut metagenome]|uniref:HTH cro/C1-type domain-containing protein n=1 Tax=termite gut metagenome TaxID=433724 RepID=A0A5J4SSJ9_9ZZZZ